MSASTTDAPWSLNGLVLGHVALVCCSVLYLVWWCLFFDPCRIRPQGGLYAFGVACILLAVLAGLLGIAGIASGLATVGSQAQERGIDYAPPPVWAFFCLAAVAYVVLALVTRLAFQRQITTELALIVGWTALEAGVVCSLAAASIIPVHVTTALFVVLGLLFVASMVCYVLYYRLDPLPGFVDGCVPLVAVGVFSLVVATVVHGIR